jgi:hypothetical protein
MPIELVMSDPSSAPKLSERKLPDGSTLLVDSSTGEDRVLRLNSTDPAHFLNPDYSPGGPVPVISSVQPAPPPGDLTGRGRAPAGV